MTWERFGYICRKAYNTLGVNEPISDCISRVESEPGCNLYGTRFSHDSLCRKFLSEIEKVQDKDKAQEILDEYGSIDMSMYLAEPMQLKRVFIYLAYVAFVFLVVSTTYQIYVFPSFLSSFETFGTKAPRYLVLYSDYWQYGALLIFFCLVLALIVGLTLKGIFKFRHGMENQFVFRFLVSKRIRASYLKIIEIISFPVMSAQVESTGHGDSMVFGHLSEVRSSGMDVVVEIQALLNAETQLLLELCERQMRAIAVVVVVIVIVAIFFFLASAYSPIFILGETV